MPTMPPLPPTRRTVRLTVHRSRRQESSQSTKSTQWKTWRKMIPAQRKKPVKVCNPEVAPLPLGGEGPAYAPPPRTRNASNFDDRAATCSRSSFTSVDKTGASIVVEGPNTGRRCKFAATYCGIFVLYTSNSVYTVSRSSTHAFSLLLPLRSMYAGQFGVLADVN